MLLPVKINSPAPQGQQEKDPLLQRKRKLTTKPVFSSFNPTKNFLSKISRVPKSDASPAKKKRVSNFTNQSLNLFKGHVSGFGACAG